MPIKQTKQPVIIISGVLVIEVEALQPSVPKMCDLYSVDLSSVDAFATRGESYRHETDARDGHKKPWKTHPRASPEDGAVSRSFC